MFIFLLGKRSKCFFYDCILLQQNRCYENNHQENILIPYHDGEADEKAKFGLKNVVSRLFCSTETLAPFKEAAQSSGQVLSCSCFTNGQRVFVRFDLQDDFLPSQDTDKLVNMPDSLSAHLWVKEVNVPATFPLLQSVTSVHSFSCGNICCFAPLLFISVETFFCLYITNLIDWTEGRPKILLVQDFKENSTTFYADVQSVLMVTLVR